MSNLKAITGTYEEVCTKIDELIGGKKIKRNEIGIWQFEVNVINDDLYTLVWVETPKVFRKQKTIRQLNDEIAEWMIMVDVDYSGKSNTYRILTKRGEKVLASAKTLLGIQRKIKPTIAMIGRNLGELHQWESLTIEQQAAKIQAGEMRPAAILPGC